MDQLLKPLLAASGGRVTRAEALRHGVLDTQVRRAIRSGELVRQGRGGYATPVAYPTPEAAHAALARATWDASRAEAISHHSALTCHGLPTYGCDLDVVHLATPRRDGRWRRPGLVVHALPRGVVPVDGLVPVPYALVQTGLAGGPFALVASADAAIRRHLTTRRDIAAAVDALTRSPGIAALRPATARIDGRSESVLESVGRLVIEVLGWSVEVQYAVEVRGRRYRADLRLAGEWVLVEFDGMGKYDDRTALSREKRREADLRSVGWEIVRLVWSDIQNPARLAMLLGNAVRRARRANHVPPP